MTDTSIRCIHIKIKMTSQKIKLDEGEEMKVRKQKTQKET